MTKLGGFLFSSGTLRIGDTFEHFTVVALLDETINEIGGFAL